MAHNLTYCGEEVKRADPDRFFLSLLSPKEKQPDLWALFAFHLEIARTREMVSETTIGLIRLQWWRDALAKVATGDIPAHKIVEDLARVIKKYNLPIEEFENLIYAREFDLEDVLPGSLDGLLKYAEATQYPLLILASLILGEGEDKESLKHLAVGYALVGLMRAMPFHARQHRCYLPADQVQLLGLKLSEYYDLKSSLALIEVTKKITSLADQRIKSLSLQSPFMRGAQALALIHLQAIEKVGFDLFDVRLLRPIPFRELRVTLRVLF